MKRKREKIGPAVSCKSTFGLQTLGERWLNGDALVLGASTLDPDVISASK